MKNKKIVRKITLHKKWAVQKLEAEAIKKHELQLQLQYYEFQ